MFMLKSLFGKVWNDPNAAELAQISTGQLYLVRSDSIKGTRECIFQNAMATIRRVMTTEFHFQLVITRVFEEGEELLLDEDDETDQERSFLIDEALQFRSGTFEDQPTFQWRDLEDDDEDLFEFVAPGANGPTVAFFMTSMYKAMYERKYSKSSAEVTDEELKQFVHGSSSPAGTSKGKKKTTRSGDDSGLASAMQKMSFSPKERPPPPPPTDKPVVVLEHGILFLWDMDESVFRRQGEVDASIIEDGPRDYWLHARGSEAFASHQIVPELNPRFAAHVQSITWNQFSSRGNQVSYCVRFDTIESFGRFKEAFAQCQYEMLHGISWDKVKPEERMYALRSYDEDVEMIDGTAVDEEDEDTVESELGAVGEGGEEEEEEGEEDYEQEEEDPQAKAFRSDGVNRQLAVSKYRSFVENRGRIGVFKNSNDTGELEFIATINKLFGPKGKAFVPKKMMLHNQDASMILQNPDAPNSLFNLDIETGKVVEEWKVHNDVTVDHIAPNTKFSQAQPDRTLVGASHNALFRVDPRLSGNKMVDSQYKQYASKNAFSGVATTASGKVAVASEKGDIRLFDVIGKNAKTALPPLGDPIIGVDVTANGRYIVATTKTYLLLIDTLIGEGKFKGQLGFDRSFPANAKPMPKRLQLKPEHAMYMEGKVSFTPARFNSTEEGQEENLIVTGNGQFVIAWDFDKVKRGKLDKYEIKRYPTRVVQDDFKFGTDKEIIVALEDNVLSTNKKQLRPATRQSLATPSRSKSSIVNSPY